jgi:hypothetical protein
MQQSNVKSKRFKFARSSQGAEPMPKFIKGSELCRLFHKEVVHPLLRTDFPGLKYSAALIGSGSEVLGFDTEMSSDHGWGPRLQLFVNDQDYDQYHKALDDAFRHKLPRTFRGYPTEFPDKPASPAGVNHSIGIYTHRSFFMEYLAFDILLDIEPADWLTFPDQKLLTITTGAIYHDELGLQSVRERFAYYPQDVWLYLLAAGWTRIGQEEHLMGRAGSVGDEIGSALIAARLVRDLMRLCFLMERQFAPYPKWFGTAFSRLNCAEELSPILKRVLSAETWQERDQHLSVAYGIVAAKHNALGITKPLPVTAAPFFNRPFNVIHLHRGFAGAIKARIQDPEVRPIAEKRLIGSIDQFSDSTDILSDPTWRMTLRRLYE